MLLAYDRSFKEKKYLLNPGSQVILLPEGTADLDHPDAQLGFVVAAGIDHVWVRFFDKDADGVINPEPRPASQRVWASRLIPCVFASDERINHLLEKYYQGLGRQRHARRL